MKDEPLQVLVVEQVETDALLAAAELRRLGREVRLERVRSPEDLQAALGRGGWDLVLCDYASPGFEELEALRITRELDPELPVIVVSGVVCEAAVVEAMRAGARDYVTKDRLVRLGPAVERELHEAVLRQGARPARPPVRSPGAEEPRADTGEKGTARIAALVAGVAAILAGALAIGGWVAGVDQLRSILPGAMEMKVNTALAFVLLGAAVLLTARGGAGGPRVATASRVCSGLSGLFGAMTLLEHAFGWDPAFQRWVETDASGPPESVGMAPDAALGFVLLASALEALGWRRRPRWAPTGAALAGVTVTILALAALQSYAMPWPGVSGWWGLSVMALPTAATFLLLGMAVVAKAWRSRIFTGVFSDAASMLFVGGLAWLVALHLNASRGQARFLELAHRGDAAAAELERVAHGAYALTAAGTLATVLVFAAVLFALDRAELAKRRAETALRRQRDELEAANRELEAFSYSISHDLRAPLRSIDGFSRIVLAQHADDLSPEAREALHVVRAGTQLMGRLIDDLLAFARLGRQPLRRRRVDPGEVVRECIDGLRPEAEGRALELTVGELPPCFADPELLRIVWRNLLANALKFTRGRQPARIEAGARVGADGLPEYFVRDNGVGFKMEHVGKLFGLFQRLHRMEDYEGTGVGLAAARRIVERHGGRMRAEGEPGGGATFFFTFPPEPTP